MNAPHYDYFLTLCEDLETTFRYVDLDPRNYATYSIEFTRLLLSIGSEVDVVAKMVCASIVPDKEPRNIDQYRAIILSHYPTIPEIEVTVRRGGLSILPWKDWKQNENPSWWKAYNNVKHHRDAHFTDANLENTLNSLAGLCALVCYLYWELLYADALEPLPRLMFLDRKYGEPAFSFSELIYQLPDTPPNPKFPRPNVGHPSRTVLTMGSHKLHKKEPPSKE